MNTDFDLSIDNLIDLTVFNKLLPFNKNNINFDFINNQIFSIFNNIKSCSYEVFYREWYNFTLKCSRDNLNANRLFIYIYNLYVPLLLIKFSIQFNITNYKFNHLIFAYKDIMLYPKNRFNLISNNILFDNFSNSYSYKYIIKTIFYKYHIYENYIWHSVLKYVCIHSFYEHIKFYNVEA